MYLAVKVESLQELRDALVGTRRGASGAFKLALAEVIYAWRRLFAKFHFTRQAYYRYPGHAYKGVYAQRSRHGWGVVGSEGRGSVMEFIGWRAAHRNRARCMYYTEKEARQWRDGWTVNPAPLVYSGRTRAGILHGQFRVRGTSKMLRGSWNDNRINWRALTRTLSFQGFAVEHTLGQGLVFTNPQEKRMLLELLEHEYFPEYLDYINSDRALPALSALPIIGAT